jgi:chitinase
LVPIAFLLFTTPALFLFSDKVICYYASWGATREGNGKFVPEDIDANLCTHVNYAFVGLNDDCTLAVLDEENDINQGRLLCLIHTTKRSQFCGIIGGLKRVSALKEINPNLKVLLSVGGATAGAGAFESAGNDPAKLDAMAQSAIEFFETYGYDGLDVDWEYPQDKATFNKLLSGLKAAFEPKGYLLTVAVNSIPGEVGGYDIPEMTK